MPGLLRERSVPVFSAWTRCLIGVVCLLVWGRFTQFARAEVGPVPHWIWYDAWPLSGQQIEVWHEIPVQGELGKAELELLADDDAAASINGEAVLESHDYSRWSRAEVTRHLKRGQNLLRIQATNQQGHAGVCVRLRLHYADGRRELIVSDPLWKTRKSGTSSVQQATSLGLVGVSPWEDPVGEAGDYYQWQRALQTPTSPEEEARVQVLPGFEIDLLRRAREGESSWISLTFDPQGRIILGCEGRDKNHGLLRQVLPEPGQSPTEFNFERLESTLLEPRGLVFHGDDLYVNANNAKALYRLRKKPDADQFEAPEKLRESPGGVGHGRNNLTVGPDGFLYSIHGNDVLLPTDFDSHHQRTVHVANDDLSPAKWNRLLFDTQAKLPGGHLIRTDRDGKVWELFASGFRNPYGIDFNVDGECFTFDADNEGDLGTPWYRPTRINHVVSGGDYGWRQGTAMRPSYYPDSLPAVLELGKSSPTDIKFGTRSNFPPRYQKSLFVLDWTYGKIYALQPVPRGASYTFTAEAFVEGQPLNVTDLEFGPDGHLYFTTGGRGTQAALYRVRYVGPENLIAPHPVVPSATVIQSAQSRRLRQSLEHLHVAPASSEAGETAVNLVWPLLGHPDLWIRHAARIALEHQPFELWQQRLHQEVNTRLKTTALLAAARSAPPEVQPELLRQLNDLTVLHWKQLPPSEQAVVARTYQLILIHGEPPASSIAAYTRFQLADRYPTGSLPVDRFLCEILTYLDSPTVVSQTMPLLKSARIPSEKLLWLYLLRNQRTGWTLEDRRTFLSALNDTPFDGGRELPVALFAIGNEFRQTLTEAEATALAPLLQQGETSGSPESLLPQRPHVKEWKIEDFAESLAQTGQPSGQPRDLQRGQTVFQAANCLVCHRFAGKGRPVGPDLKGVTHRFGRRDLLETILVPSKVVDSKYLDQTFELKSGRVVTGRVVGGDDETVLVSTNPTALFNTVTVRKDDIEEQATSKSSPMPVGLLNSFTADEILDLLAYLDSEGILQ